MSKPTTKQGASSAIKPYGQRTQRYLDRILDGDTPEDLQADALPVITKHPYPEPEGNFYWNMVTKSGNLENIKTWPLA